MDRVSKTGKVVEPAQTKGVKELLDVKYKVFLGQCERQRVCRKMVDDVTSEKPINGN
jgi:hypothetical protein